MSREIKFRIISKGKIIGYERLINGNWEWMCLELNPNKGERWNNGAFPHGKKYNREQFTSLKDKNSKDIYEGDILKVYEEDDTEKTYPVIWGDQYPAFTLDGYEDLEYNSLQHAALVQSCEIIGNIHENPELCQPN